MCAFLIQMFVLFQMATNISEHNVTAWIHELLTGEKYQLRPSKATKVDQKPSNHAEVNEEKLGKISEVEEHVDPTESKADEKIKDVKQDNNPGDFEMGKSYFNTKQNGLTQYHSVRNAI